MTQDFGRWTYGKAGDIYPVRVGEVWEVGDATFLCGDITKMPSLASWDYGLFYCDPPWNQGNMRSFRTKAALHDKMPFLEFVRAFARLAARSRGESYMESSIHDKPESPFFPAFRDVGLRQIGSWIGTYYGRSPMSLTRWVRAGAAPVKAADALNLTGVDDEHMPDKVLAAYPPMTVFDPCVGQGLTARAAYRTGHRFIGVELHPRRLADALMRQADLVGQEPKRVQTP